MLPAAMSAVGEAIEIKKAGGALDPELISTVVNGYTLGSVPDYQMSALLMAIFLLLSVSVVAANLVTDLVYMAVDPRVRLA